MNSKNLEQARIFKRYLLERANRSRSRLMRDQIRRWVERLDAVQGRERDWCVMVVLAKRCCSAHIYSRTVRKPLMAKRG